MNKPLMGLSVLASIASILCGAILIVMTLSDKTTSEWSRATADMVPQAVLIAGGVIALAILSRQENHHQSL